MLDIGLTYDITEEYCYYVRAKRPRPRLLPDPHVLINDGASPFRTLATCRRSGLAIHDCSLACRAVECYVTRSAAKEQSRKDTAHFRA